MLVIDAWETGRQIGQYEPGATAFLEDHPPLQSFRRRQVPPGHLTGPRLALTKNGLGNLVPGTTGQLAAAMRHQLDRIQRQPVPITGFLGQTGLTLDPQPP